MSQLTLHEVAEKVYNHAVAHYEEDGWDEIVECMTINEIEEELREEKISDEITAIKHYHEICKLRKDVGDDIRGA